MSRTSTAEGGGTAATTNNSLSDANTAVEEPSDVLHIDQPTEADRTNDRIDTYIAKALGDLSLQERDKVYHELHGVDQAVEETYEFVEAKLEAFDLALNEAVQQQQQQHSQRMYAYQLAYAQAPEYLQRRSFRLAFLRADRFDAHKAADRFLRFFDLKFHLFGSEKLCKDITLNDLDKEDMKTLKAGFMQVLPARDSAGRAICILLPNYQTYKEPNNFVSRQCVMSSLCCQDTDFYCPMPLLIP